MILEGRLEMEFAKWLLNKPLVKIGSGKWSVLMLYYELPEDMKFELIQAYAESIGEKIPNVEEPSLYDPRSKTGTHYPWEVGEYMKQERIRLTREFNIKMNSK